MPDGAPVPDAQMEDLLSQVEAARDNLMPRVWCMYRTDDKRAGKLLTAHGFDRVASKLSEEHDVWLRPGGLTPGWWRAAAGKR